MWEGGQPASASQTSRKKRSSREKQQGEVPLGIPPAGSTWVASSEFQNLPVINLTGHDNPPAARPQDTSTPIKATPLTGRHVSGGKINVSKVDAQHLLWKMEDRQELARQRAEAEASDRTSDRGQGSGSGLPYGLPATLPNLGAEEGIPAKPSDQAPTASKQGKKRSHANDDDEVTELPAGDEARIKQKRRFPFRRFQMTERVRAVPRQSRRKPQNLHRRQTRPEFWTREQNSPKRKRRRRKAKRILASRGSDNRNERTRPRR